MAQAVARTETLRNAFTQPALDGPGADWSELSDALEDDFDTPRALAVLHGWASAHRLELLRRGLAVFGLESLADREAPPPDVENLAEQRQHARTDRDFETADRLRDQLATAGWEMRDEPDGGFTLVRRA